MNNNVGGLKSREPKDEQDHHQDDLRAYEEWKDGIRKAWRARYGSVAGFHDHLRRLIAANPEVQRMYTHLQRLHTTERPADVIGYDKAFLRLEREGLVTRNGVDEFGEILWKKAALADRHEPPKAH